MTSLDKIYLDIDKAQSTLFTELAVAFKELIINMQPTFDGGHIGWRAPIKRVTMELGGIYQTSKPDNNHIFIV